MLRARTLFNLPKAITTRPYVTHVAERGSIDTWENEGGQVPHDDRINYATYSGQYRVSPWDKRILVWSRMYKNIRQVPENIEYETMEQARKKMWFGTNMTLAFLAAFGLSAFIFYKTDNLLQDQAPLKDEYGKSIY